MQKKRKTFRNKNRFNLNFFNTPGKPDKILLGLIVGLTLFGLIMVYSSSFIAHSNPFHFFIRQLVYVFIGSICGFIAYMFDYRMLPKLILPGLIVSIILLIVVLIPGIGTEINGARRWIDLPLFDLQPSEVAKLCFIVYLASWSSKVKSRVTFSSKALEEHFKEELLPFISILGLICLLVLLEPDLDTTVIIGFTSLTVYLLSGRDKIHTLGTIMISTIMGLFALAAGILAPYRFARIQTYLKFLQTGVVDNPLDSGYQLRNILIAVGSGGLFGVGFGESRQKFHYLGLTAFSDNIFAVIAEEFGLIGSVLLTGAFFYMLLRGLALAQRVPDRFGKLLMSGIIIWFVFQAFLHISANIGLIPVSGIPLPFISYGGSSMIVNLTAAGILLNVTKAIPKN